jgi:regulatory protein
VPDDGDELKRALGLAYRYLNHRERTTQEVRRHLERKDVEVALAEEAVRVLVGQGYLDDARFARLFMQDKRELEQWGTERIRHGLLARGVATELIDQSLAGEGDDGSELDRAVGLLARRFASPPRTRRDRDRALGILIRKGYDPELALDALAAYSRAAA